MKPLIRNTTVLVLALMASATAIAGNDFGAGLKAGTLGIGLEGTWRPLPYFDLRLGTNLFDYDEDGSRSGVDYDSTLNLESYYATANFRFPLSPFRVTAGVYANGNELNLTSRDSSSFNIGGQIYTAADVGRLSSTASFKRTAPYVGIGYDFSAFGKVGINFDLGVLWQGEPEVTLTANGLLATDPTFLAALETERQELLDSVNDFKAWPVISLGFVFNF